MNIKYIKDRCVEVGDCWIWQGAVGASGYPITKASGVKSGCVLVRRLAVELDGRPAKPRQPVRATCNDKKCCNPDHLVPSTWSAIGKIAGASGAFSGVNRCAKIAKAKRERDAKLTVEQVQEIRESTEAQRKIAERMGVNKNVIQSIRAGKAWKDYSNPFAGLIR